MEIFPVYISKINSKCQKLNISNKDKKGWHYLSLTKLPALLRGITSKNKISGCGCDK